MVQGATERAPTSSDDTTILGSAVLTEEDFKRAWSSLPQMRAMVVYLAFLVVTLCVFLGYRFFDGTNALPLTLGTSVIAAGAIGLGIYRGRSRWARTATEQLRGGAVEYRLDQQGIATRSPGTEARVDWNTVHRFVEAPSAFLIYTTPAYAVIMPKRAFSERDHQPIRELLGRRIQPRPKDRSLLRRAILLWAALIVCFLSIWQFLATK
ncbi:MAG: YcxB family protein [Myxococcota bacterium]